MHLTRQQAKENQLELCDSCLKDEALELIDLIFDGVEGRSCEGCKFYVELNPDMIDAMRAEKCTRIDIYINKDFYCNKWEKKNKVRCMCGTSSRTDAQCLICGEFAKLAD